MARTVYEKYFSQSTPMIEKDGFVYLERLNNIQDGVLTKYEIHSKFADTLSWYPNETFKNMNQAQAAMSAYNVLHLNDIQCRLDSLQTELQTTKQTINTSLNYSFTSTILTIALVVGFLFKYIGKK